MEKTTNADRKPNSNTGFIEKHLPTLYNLARSIKSQSQNIPLENSLEYKKEAANAILKEIKRANPKNGFDQYAEERLIEGKYLEAYKYLCLFFDEASKFDFELTEQDIRTLTYVTDMFYKYPRYNKVNNSITSKSEIKDNTTTVIDNSITDSKLDLAVIVNISKIRESGRQHNSVRAHNYLNTFDYYITELEARWKEYQIK